MNIDYCPPRTGIGDYVLTATIVAPPSFELRRFLPTRLKALSNRLVQTAALVYTRRFNLSVAEWRTVAVLAERGTTATSAVIAQTSMDKVRVSRAVAKLVKAGLITREANPENRRLAILDLTPAGRQMYRQIAPLLQDAETEMLASLTQTERDGLTRVLAKIEACLDRIGPEADIDEPQGTRRV